MKTATVDGVRIAYRDEGSGEPPLLFIHGWCCDNSYWDPQVAALSPWHRVVALDLPGYGASDKPERQYHVEGFARDVLGLAGALGLDRPVLIGHSMGGVTSFVAAALEPARVRGIVMVDPVLPPTPPPQEMVTPILAFMASLRTDGYRESMKAFIQEYLLSETSPDTLRTKVLEGMPRAEQRVLAPSFEGLIATSMAPPPFATPAVWIAAEKRIGGPELGPEVEARWPSIRFVDMPGTAHFVHLEAPDRVNRTIEDFVEGLK